VRRAGPLLSVGFEGTSPPDAVLDLVREREIGGVSLFARNVRDPAQTRDLVGALTEAGTVPIAMDQEGGNVVRMGFGTVFPSAMALGATRDPALVERVAAAVAHELRAFGIRVLLAPVCDVNVAPKNPVIGTRAFSDDPVLCASLADAWIRGAQSAGVACTAKHFPGHGATSADSHHVHAEVGDDRGTIERRDLLPFRAAINARVAQVMTAHVRYPAFDRRPATYSAAILQGLLRRELGFDGVICSDALEMRGAELDDGVPAAEAIAAGVDIAHLSVFDGYGEAIDGIERAVSRGAIAPERMADALRRARAFSALYACERAQGQPASANGLALEAATRSVTHIGPALPQLGSGGVRCVAFSFRTPSPVEELRDPLSVLEHALRRRFGGPLTFARDPREPVLPDREATVVLVTSSARFDPAQEERARRIFQACRDRAAGLVHCALRSPYDADMFTGVPVLLTYGDVPASCEALAACLAGEAEPRGRLPVRLGARYDRFVGEGTE
jgi:beta-N-acetylhexosaminidase